MYHLITAYGYLEVESAGYIPKDLGCIQSAVMLLKNAQLDDAQVVYCRDTHCARHLVPFFGYSAIHTEDHQAEAEAPYGVVRYHNLDFVLLVHHTDLDKLLDTYTFEVKGRRVDLILCGKSTASPITISQFQVHPGRTVINCC